MRIEYEKPYFGSEHDRYMDRTFRQPSHLSRFRYAMPSNELSRDAIICGKPRGRPFAFRLIEREHTSGPKVVASGKQLECGWVKRGLTKGQNWQWLRGRRFAEKLMT